MSVEDQFVAAVKVIQGLPKDGKPKYKAWTSYSNCFITHAYQNGFNDTQNRNEARFLSWTVNAN